MITDYNLIYKLILIFLYGLFATYIVTKYLIRKFRAKGLTVRDMYKPDKPEIPSMGGLAIVCGLMVAVVLSQLIIKSFSTADLLIFYFIVIVYGVFGLVDDLIDIGRKIKVIAPYFMALPIALLVADTQINFFFINWELGSWFIYLIAPVYVMVCANLINMHSGFNGLSGGLSAILMFFIGVKVLMVRDVSTLFLLLPIFGALIGFMCFNRYPSKIFLGNSGALLLGAAIGGLLIVNNLEIFGIIILIPHIINFIMWRYWQLRKYPHIKFAKLRKDGSIQAPNALTIKYLVTKLFRVGELRAVLICYLITIVFGVVGLVVV